ncbi:4'-phosphopantetheinyl transferase superfamily protein [Chitinibacter bivalviorum]|uniref:4'-phosphopantetheinyl transferase superfamily protein n=1 Tax=Chitinibacter bivalviorum TaxID=2739434 RepID=A0A7H9BE31_9NEIS|nr:4'-phosphopantetheinyl transferase superfamily protein [Chitinibacter bivalviorum]QLG86973.1 4'-phosphopantetheinyl transferase superfamily protein [Chitinibacter bivalviorum]
MASLLLRRIGAIVQPAHFEQWLDDHQRVRLSQMANPARRQQFIAARSLAIELLQAQGVEPQLQQHAAGRPVASAWHASEGLSWSHTEYWAAAALGEGRVGVDVELIRTRATLLNIAEKYFTPNEYLWLASLSESAQPQAFATLWVAKEALLKALGTGLVGGLARFELTYNDDGRWQLRSTDEQAWYVQVWLIAGQAMLAVASDRQQTWSCDSPDVQLVLNCQHHNGL